MKGLHYLQCFVIFNKNTYTTTATLVNGKETKANQFNGYQKMCNELVQKSKETPMSPGKTNILSTAGQHKSERERVKPTKTHLYIIIIRHNQPHIYIGKK